LKVKSFVQRTIYGRLPQPFGLRNDLDSISSANSAAPAVKLDPNEISTRRYLMGQKKMKNKAN
jgi:hypothetical protein